MKRIQLSHEQFFKLSEMLRTEREWFIRTNPSWDGAAKYVSAKIGFEVSPANVASVAKITGVTWNVARRAGSSKLKELEGALREQRHTIDSLQVLIHHLYQQLGAQYPAGVRPAPPPAVVGNSYHGPTVHP
jgi:hypothetical protein